MFDTVLLLFGGGGGVGFGVEVCSDRGFQGRGWGGTGAIACGPTRRSPVRSEPVQVLLHLSCERRRRRRPVCSSVFNFALSSNCYVDSLNDVCSRINTEVNRAALIQRKKRPLLRAVSGTVTGNRGTYFKSIIQL